MNLLYAVVLLLICASNFWLARHMQHRSMIYLVSGAGCCIALLAVVFQWSRMRRH